jgi:hypothetical protein
MIPSISTTTAAHTLKLANSVTQTPAMARFPLAVCVSYQQGNRGKHGLLVQAYVAYDLTDCTPKKVEALYQKRSAIETAFRMMGATDCEQLLFAFSQQESYR